MYMLNQGLRYLTPCFKRDFPNDLQIFCQVVFFQSPLDLRETYLYS